MWGGYCLLCIYFEPFCCLNVYIRIRFHVYIAISLTYVLKSIKGCIYNLSSYQSISLSVTLSLYIYTYIFMHELIYICK